MNFSKQKNGYCEKEVDEYVSSINSKNEQEVLKLKKTIDELKKELEKASEKEKSIALALTSAVDKAKEIEESSRNIYKLKLEQMGMLYTKWEILLSEMIKKYPDVNISNVREDMKNLRNSIKVALKDDFNIELMAKTPATDPIKTLLNRIMGMKAEEIAKSGRKVRLISRKNTASPSQKTELENLEERTFIKPIINVKIEQGENYENLVDKFLSSDDNVPENFAKILNVPDYSKGDGNFDLNEAINPKEDLEEIMKSFDFYNQNWKIMLKHNFFVCPFAFEQFFVYYTI